MKTKLPESAIDGARKITTFWMLKMCDRRGCAHDHRKPTGDEPTRDIFADIRLVEDLRRLERGDVADIAEAPAHTDEREGDAAAQAEKIPWLVRMFWESAARWLGLEDVEKDRYEGEEAGGPV
jgi:hypothetical protein